MAASLPLGTRKRSLGSVSSTIRLLISAPLAMLVDKRQALMKLGPVTVSDSGSLLDLVKVRGLGITCPGWLGALIGGSTKGLLSGSLPSA